MFLSVLILRYRPVEMAGLRGMYRWLYSCTCVFGTTADCIESANVYGVIYVGDSAHSLSYRLP